jgi:hypothetical protein
MRKQLLAAVGGGSVLAGGWLVRRYRHDVAAAVTLDRLDPDLRRLVCVSS